MAKTKAPPATSPDPPPRPAEYTVVARRYRPQQFADLIGQEHVSQALVNALQSGRVAHAYLFTGARGVGKTSAARILAKALNCVAGPTATPCDKCDSCAGITAGEDVDVLEIDGASNNKVEEIRDLRQNVGFRPTRSRYKIYIIDEVHMLSTSAFNALLKTLEEPPPHVKFIFATTEVQKIPITILSRCQRFDFAHVGPAKIFEQLKRIVRQEGLEADDDALQLVARRAAGSMRDSQSLLDQLLASASGRLTAERVHGVLGTTGSERVVELAAAILNHDPKSALNLIAGWVDRGLQIGELVDQLVEHWRSLMLISCGPDLQTLPVSPGERETLFQQSSKLTLDTILAGLEVWTTTKARMRGSGHTQVLLEMAVVRLSRMGEVLSVGQLIQTLGQNGVPSLSVPVGGTPPSAASGMGRGDPREPDVSKKNGLMDLAKGSTSSHNEGDEEAAFQPLILNEKSLTEVWRQFLRFLTAKSPILANHLKFAHPPAIFGPNSLAIRFHTSYNHAYEACATEFNVQKLQDVLRKLTGQPGTIRIDLVSGPVPVVAKPVVTPAPAPAADRKKQLMGLPLFKKAADALGAQIWHMDDDFNPNAAPPKPVVPTETEADPDEV
ncbi:MAG: dnaX 1 [Gemmataceae bacterium]|nr:dnaX 1 [Gemmataceae bacterium]